MYASDLIFNGHSTKEFGVVIGTFDNEIGVATGGEIEVKAIVAPNKDKQDYYGDSIPDALVWSFSIFKDMDVNTSKYFTHDEERHIAKWLLFESGFKCFNFLTDDPTEIYYFGRCNMRPHQIGGRTAGFDITITSNCGYGFSKEYKRTEKFNLYDTVGNLLKSKSIQLQVNSDLQRKVYPIIKIENAHNGFTIKNSDNKGNIIYECIVEKSNKGNDIIFESENDIVYGLDNANDFNYVFPYLISGMNSFTCDSTEDITFTISYREIRRVIV